MIDLVKWRNKTNSLLAQYHHLSEQVRDERKLFKEAKQEVTAALEAQSICQEVAESVQEIAHRQIASLVSSCLKAVFEEEAYEFKIKFAQKRGKTEARLVFEKGGLEITPKDASSGGQIDLAAFALRLACLWMQKPQRRKLLVLDEPLKFLNGSHYQERVGELLLKLAKDMKLQLIIVTDDEWLKVGKIVELV